ncbi:MAG: hypothetical protein ABUS57_07600, partial [Pseudomonadota bacterium]
LRSIAAEASARSETNGERRVLNRIDKRLSVVNGAALVTDAGGWCSDTAEDWAFERRNHTPAPSVDVW